MSLSNTLRPIRSKDLAKLAGIALIVGAAAPASAQTPVVFGGTISDPGVYFLAGNQTGSGSDGITIASGDVTLLLGRFTLRGDGTHTGIRSLGYDNVTIWGGRVRNFETGIAVTDGMHCTVKDTRIDDCAGLGLLAANVNESWFLRLRCDHNHGDGVDAEECVGSRFVSILAHDNDGNGIALSENKGFAGGAAVLGSTVRLCWASYNDLDGIRVLSSNDHQIVSNECVNNGRAGIHLATIDLAADASASAPIHGSEHNFVKSNWCVFNHDGIVVDAPGFDNTLTINTALANFGGHDMVDDNDEPPCANTWFLNSFLTKDGDGEDCIF